jgi:hypothetical protein
MAQSESLSEFTKALCAAQSEMRPVVKKHEAKIASQKGNFAYEYADLPDVWDGARAILAKHGFAVTQPTFFSGEWLMLRTVLLHSSGEWMDCELPVSLGATPPQALKSAITYMRRAGFELMVGSTAKGDDDDAAIATAEHARSRESQPARRDGYGQHQPASAPVSTKPRDSGRTDSRTYPKLVADASVKLGVHAMDLHRALMERAIDDGKLQDMLRDSDQIVADMAGIAMHDRAWVVKQLSDMVREHASNGSPS